MHLPKDPPQSGLTGCTLRAVCERDPLEASLCLGDGKAGVQGGILRPSFKPPFQLCLITVSTLWTFQLPKLINYKHTHILFFPPTKPICVSATCNPTSSGQYTNISSLQDRFIFQGSKQGSSSVRGVSIKK